MLPIKDVKKPIIPSFSTVVPDTYLGIYRRITEKDEFKVGVSAHIGGFVAGKSSSTDFFYAEFDSILQF